MYDSDVAVPDDIINTVIWVFFFCPPGLGLCFLQFDPKKENSNFPSETDRKSDWVVKLGLLKRAHPHFPWSSIQPSQPTFKFYKNHKRMGSHKLYNGTRQKNITSENYSN